MPAFGTDERNTDIPDLFSVLKDSDAYILDARLAPENVSLDITAGECSSFQSVDTLSSQFKMPRH